MGAYILRRLLLIIPTLLGIMLLNFIIIQFVPGGPVEQVLLQLKEGSSATGATDRFSGGSDGGLQGQITDTESGYRGSRGLEQELKDELTKQFGLDKPAYERFALMIWNYAHFDFGESFFRSASVIDLIIEKMPVSISLGLWATLISYLVSIPLGIAKAVRDGTPFDAITSAIIIAAYAIPIFLFAVMLLVLFAGGTYFDWFPLRGLGSDNWYELSFGGKVLDYLWHITLPVFATLIGSFAVLTLLTKNSFLDEIGKQYVMTARAKGLSERGVLYGHVFRNGMLIVVAGFPGAFLGAFFAGSLFIETVFSLDGLGFLGYEAVLNRDYPIVLGTLYIFGLMGLLIRLISDLTYVLIDPRIDFERRQG
ncbi:microcin C ABC transporter permease YejB [Rhodobacteraceae bacterium NNCM2]|nr:microcin C ABC transporter permease YejB [Coraliihabitans acroporae]